MRRAISVTFVVAFVLAPTAAFALAGQGDAGRLINGFTHPITSLAHVLAMLAPLACSPSNSAGGPCPVAQTAAFRAMRHKQLAHERKPGVSRAGWQVSLSGHWGA
jgi:hydrogenase/urease accessory protein HupE